MDLIYKKFSRKDSKFLVDFLCSQSWEFHSEKSLNRKIIHKKIKEGYYTKRDQVTFLVFSGKSLAGFFRIFDLADAKDGSPLFDLRISSSFRNKGIGTKVMGFMLEYLFKNYPSVRKIEGTTREDNFAMQNLFKKMGFKKAARFRKDWKGEGNIWHDTLGYDLLKEEFEK